VGIKVHFQFTPGFLMCPTAPKRLFLLFETLTMKTRKYHTEFHLCI